MCTLKDKVVIITGGSKGIGKACCVAFAKAGANVVFTYYKSKAEAEFLKKELKSLNTGCLSLRIDVRSYQECRKVVEEALKKFKKIDILINNAGIIKDKALVMMSLEEWQDVIDTNLGGTFNMTKSVITTFLKQKKGIIINIGSVSGLAGIPRQTNYSASKAGIVGFSKALAKEVAPYNIRVNVVCPGYISTDMLSSLREDTKKEILKNIPVKRLGQPREIADFCVFLASDKAGYITGDVIKIDGGLAM